ncbi:MAG: PRC-barrel domain-containing protein [Phycisphaerales bacterium]|jgi:sporulation protein YlmC with PRC-barrel domain|nr:PRC-barrel domain-containing protein [Phycisphaerales bacterium]
MSGDSPANHAAVSMPHEHLIVDAIVVPVTVIGDRDGDEKEHAMNTRISKTTLAYVALAGLAASVPMAVAQDGARRPNSTQQKDQARQPQSAQKSDRELKHVTTFITGDALIGMNVVNPSGEDLGTISDAILSRGTGRVDHLIIRDGGLLGIGGRLVAIPFSAFRYDVGRERLELRATPEEIENAPEFDPEAWVGLDDTSLARQLRETMGDDRTHDPRRDQFQIDPKNAEEVRISGTISEIDRSRSDHNDENIIAHVHTEKGKTEKVILGPSWYVMSGTVAPMRGDTIEVVGYRLPREGDQRIVARTIDLNDKSIELRSRDATPNWMTPIALSESTSQDAGLPGRTLVRLSTLMGMPVRARGDDAGEIEGAVLEIRSGQIAVLELDPDSNFLGIADETRCVPWTVAAVGPEHVAIDADKSMLENCEPMPDNVEVFASPENLRPVYQAFNVKMTEFEPRMRTSWDGAALQDGPEHEALQRQIAAGESVKVNGTVERITTTRMFEGEAECTALVINADGATKTVVVGPEKLLARERVSFKEGDRVSIDAVRITHDGNPVLIARSLAGKDQKRIALWDDSRSAWSGR